jgi:hypothetical protein
VPAVTPVAGKVTFTAPVVGLTVIDESELLTEETAPPPDPLEASVIRPFASTVMLAFVYAPGVTPVLARVAVADPGPEAVTSPVSAVM